MFGKIEINVSNDDSFAVDKLIDIGGSGVGNSIFKTWRIEFIFTRKRELIETMERILPLLKSKTTQTRS